ncbi:MAG TPA: transposase, partial [Roseiarcus sp.]|nr:transposase [Roseiarcus sp.]
FQGQMTCERIVTLLNGVGVVISKRQVVRLLTARLERFRAEDAEVLKAGLSSASFVTVDDTGARHQGKPGFTTPIGSDTFAVFRTGPSKSRLAFLRNLLGDAASYGVNEAGLVSMRACNLSLALIDKLAGHPTRLFASHEDWTSAGQFRVGEHALCWVHAERLVHKLILANDRPRNAVEVARRMIWWFYRALKEYKLAPSPEKAERLRAQFDRIFNRSRTGSATLDSLLRRLFRLKDDLLRVLDHPDIPLHTNASENDIRGFVTKRKISGGTVNDTGRDARDAMLGLAKTCRKPKIPFFHYLGARLAIPAPDIPNLATLIRPAPS